MEMCKVCVCMFRRTADKPYERGINIFNEDNKSIIIDKEGKLVTEIYDNTSISDDGCFITKL